MFYGSGGSKILQSSTGRFSENCENLRITSRPSGPSEFNLDCVILSVSLQALCGAYFSDFVY
jgi:hypothetical protein